LPDEFNINTFYDFLANKELKVVRCRSCGKFVMPPSSRCKNCFSVNLEWVKLMGSGKILSFSEIHVSNKEFESRIPYVVAIVEMDEGVRLPGIVKNATRSNIEIDSRVLIKLDNKRADRWPYWPTYHFELQN